MFKYTQSHEWIKLEANQATVGITDYAQHSLGDIVFIELPSVGDKLQQGSRFGTIESTKAASELYSPVSGEVVAVNSELTSTPQLVNQEPQAKGWMIKIKVSNQTELAQLLDEKAYQDLIKTQ